MKAFIETELRSTVAPPWARATPPLHKPQGQKLLGVADLSGLCFGWPEMNQADRFAPNTQRCSPVQLTHTRTYVAMEHKLWLHFEVDEHPFATYFDVHQGYRVLTRSHIICMQAKPNFSRISPLAMSSFALIAGLAAHSAQ